MQYFIKFKDDKKSIIIIERIALYRINKNYITTSDIKDWKIKISIKTNYASNDYT